jgi:hypothetical protein
LHLTNLGLHNADAGPPIVVIRIGSQRGSVGIDSFLILLASVRIVTIADTIAFLLFISLL